VYKNGSRVENVAGVALNDVLAYAYDADNNTIQFYRNGAAYGAQISTDIADYVAYGITNGTTVSDSVRHNYNFGQRPFTYTPPTGFVALNTQNLPTPAISNGANYMAATTYSGDGTNPRTITNSVNNIGFQPDFIWAKVRSTTYSNTLYDSVRGGANALFSDTTSAESTNYANGQILAFNSNGFNVNAGVVLNQSGQTYVTWQWKAGGTSSSNTNGSITSTVSVNATAGFSVVTYTGTGANATVGHGLGVAPKMMIIKERSAVNDWVVYTSTTTASNRLLLNSTAASTVSSTQFNNTEPTSSVFTVGTSTATNASTQTFVAYCFSEVAGYSKFGSYTGNGSADGPFVFCGFRPRWVMIKCSSSGGAGFEWELVDTSRNTSNVTNLVLYPNLSDAEATASTAILDITSNGFKLRGSANIINASSATYIFAAFAENPFKNSLAR
jgi:hypothetical protein